MTEWQRDEVAKILEVVARDGLPGPRDLDVALDAIEFAIVAISPEESERKQCAFGPSHHELDQ